MLASSRAFRLFSQSAVPSRAFALRRLTDKSTSSASSSSSSSSSSKKPEKKKKLRRANAPKQPRSAYLYFSIDRFPHFRSLYPRLPVSEISRLAANEWSSLSESERWKYSALAVADRQRYVEEKAVYEESLPPKQARNAYTFFVQSAREQIVRQDPSLSFAEVGVQLGRRWRGLPREERARFERAAANDKRRYAEELRLFQNKTESE